MSKLRRGPATRATPRNLDRALQSNDLTFVLEVYTDACCSERKVDNVVVKKLVHRITGRVGSILRHLLQMDDMKGMLDIVRQIERNEVVQTVCIKIPEFRKARELVAAEYGDAEIRVPPAFHSWLIYQGEDRRVVEQMLEAERLLAAERERVRYLSASRRETPSAGGGSAATAAAPLGEAPLGAEPRAEWELDEASAPLGDQARSVDDIAAQGTQQLPATAAEAVAQGGDGGDDDDDEDLDDGLPEASREAAARCAEASEAHDLATQGTQPSATAAEAVAQGGDGGDDDDDDDVDFDDGLPEASLQAAARSAEASAAQEELEEQAAHLREVLGASKAAMQDVSERALRLERELAEERSRRLSEVGAEEDDILVHPTLSLILRNRALQKEEQEAAGGKACEEAPRRELESKLQEAESLAEQASTSLHEERRHADKRLRLFLQDLQGHIREAHASKDAALQKLFWARSELAARDRSSAELRAELMSKSRGMERLECRLDEALEAKETLRWQLLQMESQSDAKQKVGAEASEWLRQLHSHKEDIEGSRSAAGTSRFLRGEFAEVEQRALLTEEHLRSEVSELRSELRAATGQLPGGGAASGSRGEDGQSPR